MFILLSGRGSSSGGSKSRASKFLDWLKSASASLSASSWALDLAWRFGWTRVFGVEVLGFSLTGESGLGGTILLNCLLGGVLLGGEIRSLLGVLSRLERLSLERVRVLSLERALELSLERDLRSDLVADPDLALSVLEVLDDEVEE